MPSRCQASQRPHLLHRQLHQSPRLSQRSPASSVACSADSTGSLSTPSFMPRPQRRGIIVTTGEGVPADGRHALKKSMSKNNILGEGNVEEKRPSALERLREEITVL